ncbi:MAG TPA: hypothetical protein VLJ16_05595 [Acidobacteriota bacterium]|nr:hypothetical protein [Acidobacteriota bacterium]
MKRMRLGFFAASAALILGSAAVAAAAQQSAVASAWAAEPPVVDGLTKDWEGVPLVDGKANAVSYAFRNDGGTLYILLVIRDPKYKSTIEGTGVRLTIDAKGGKAKDYSILFKKQRLDPEQYIAHLEKQGPVSEDDKAALRRKAGFFLYHHQVLDQKGKPVQELSEAVARPAVFKYASEGPVVAYEFSVPLARVSALASGVGAGPGSSIGIGFEWGGETEEMRKAAAKRLREGANTANEQIGGGMAGTSLDTGPRGAGPAAKRMPTPKKYSFWATVKLAASGS